MRLRRPGRKTKEEETAGKKMIFNTVLGLLIPFVGTALGAATVFLLKRDLNEKVQKFLLGFASGVMVAASVWSLLLPSAEMAAEQGVPEWLPPAAGFALGMLALLALDTFVPHQHIDAAEAEGRKSSFSRSKLLLFSVTLHNIPEGMAVGAVFAGLLAGGVPITAAGAFALSAGIALQNFPEGAVISMPLLAEGNKKGKAFGYGVLSGAVEPVAGLITVLFTSLVTPVLPYLLSFAAGAMIYVVVEELIPSSQSGKHTNIATVGVLLGFTAMMILDMALG